MRTGAGGRCRKKVGPVLITHLSSVQRSSGKCGEDGRHKCIVIYKKNKEKQACLESNALVVVTVRPFPEWTKRKASTGNTQITVN